MDITRDNFNNSLPVIQNAIHNSTFLSIDGEFTGLTNGIYNVSAYDLPKERYQKLNHNTADFLLIQFGLSAFCWNKDKQSYDVEAFNFSIFPSTPSCPAAPERVFTCQSSSLEFLIQQGFDFNSTFKHGIPYLRSDEEAKIKKALEEKQAQRQQSPVKDSSRRVSVGLMSPTHDNPAQVIDQKTKEFIEKVAGIVEKFLNEDEKEELMLDPCNSYLRKVLFETLPVKFPSQLLLESRLDEKSKQRCIVVVRGADEELIKIRQEKLKEQEDAEFQNAIGFAKVIRMLTESKKLIIGHNMMLDLMYSVRQFVSALPPTLDEFKSLLLCIFPQVLDTKLMASQLPFKDIILSTVLNDLYNQLKSPPFKLPDIEVPGKYKEMDEATQSSKLHEAAYDSFITGSAFAAMLHHLSSLRNADQSSTTPDMALIQPYINKVYLMRSCDIPYINLSGPDLSPSRNHVFHVTFPSSWKSGDLRQLFTPFGNISISWINDTTCFVAIHDKAQAGTVLKQFANSADVEPCNYQVKTFQEYLATSPFITKEHESETIATNKSSVTDRKRSNNENNLDEEAPTVKKAKSDSDSSEAIKAVTPEKKADKIPKPVQFEVPDVW